ncbi:AraC family transcriptional regulator [uncultured Megasphaera sp.]|uniref:helix-turn-helix domain-containing protein n=1 Tax=uncultured Megasphaera sp. TaxID=165188 RepID=UPI00265A5A9A|nr:helix-turn-helix transcriptional regulator [uncultured Megasphaera sp.]
MNDMSTLRMVEQTEDMMSFAVENESGTAELTRYEVYPGVELLYIDAHLQEFSCYAPPLPNVFAINHCEEGRVECAFQNGECLYMGQNDMSVGWRSNRDYCHSAYFPSAHYHGLSILIHVEKAQPILDAQLGADSFSLEALCNRFCVYSDFGMIVQENHAMRHLFSELYHVPAKIRRHYVRIKIMEILLFLSAMDCGPQSKPFILTSRQVQVVKEVRNDLVHNLKRKITIEEVAAQHTIAATTLKRCFKIVYGKTIGQYMKEFRIEESKKLLTKTAMNIVHIAALVGYSNSSKFSANFLRSTGMKPHEYRRLYYEGPETDEDTSASES